MGEGKKKKKKKTKESTVDESFRASILGTLRDISHKQSETKVNTDQPEQPRVVGQDQGNKKKGGKKRKLDAENVRADEEGTREKYARGESVSASNFDVNEPLDEILHSCGFTQSSILFKEMINRGCDVSRGRWTKKEDALLQQNWKQFFRIVKWDDPSEFIGHQKLEPEKRTRITKIMKEEEFWLRIGKGIVRPCESIRDRLRIILAKENAEIDGKFTEEEDARLLRVHNVHGNDWKKIGTIMGRQARQCASRWRTLQLATNPKGKPWTVEEDVRLLTEVDRLADATDGIPSWPAIGECMPQRSYRQCFYRWHCLKSEQITEEDRDLILKRIEMQKVDDQALVNWQELTEQFGHRFTTMKLRKAWGDMVHTLQVELGRKLELPETLRLLKSRRGRTKARAVIKKDTTAPSTPPSQVATHSQSSKYIQSTNMDEINTQKPKKRKKASHSGENSFTLRDNSSMDSSVLDTTASSMIESTATNKMKKRKKETRKEMNESMSSEDVNCVEVNDTRKQNNEEITAISIIGKSAKKKKKKRNKDDRREINERLFSDNENFVEENVVRKEQTGDTSTDFTKDQTTIKKKKKKRKKKIDENIPLDNRDLIEVKKIKVEQNFDVTPATLSNSTKKKKRKKEERQGINASTCSDVENEIENAQNEKTSAASLTDSTMKRKKKKRKKENRKDTDTTISSRDRNIINVKEIKKEPYDDATNYDRQMQENTLNTELNSSNVGTKENIFVSTKGRIGESSGKLQRFIKRGLYKADCYQETYS